MTREDIVRHDDGSLVARVRPHPWRRLKTKGSERDVPLEGEARWAALRILEQQTPSLFAFPRYNKTDTTKANSASAALNKWMKEYVPEGCSMHSFRHSMRDRLRAVECPADIVDQIGGWQTDGVGHGYGSGYPMDVLQKWIIMATLTSLIEMSALSIAKQRPESINSNALVIISLPYFSKLATTDRAGWCKEFDTIWLAFHRFKRQDARTKTTTDK